VKTAFIALAVIAVVGAAAWYAFSGEQPATSPAVPVARAQAEAPVVRIGDLHKSPQAYVGKRVAVEGRITRECPTTGCWWYVKDATGEIRADSSSTGFVMAPRQAGKHVRTTGKVVRTESGEVEIVATNAKVW